MKHQEIEKNRREANEKRGEKNQNTHKNINAS